MTILLIIVLSVFFTFKKLLCEQYPWITLYLDQITGFFEFPDFKKAFRLLAKTYQLNMDDYPEMKAFGFKINSD